jgi:hypothetical protein
VVRTAVAEGQLEGLEANGSAEQLVAETDADHRLAADHPADVLDHVVEGRGIAGSVGEKDEVRIAGEGLLGGAVAGQQGDPAAALPELADDRELDSGVDPDHVRSGALDLDGL